MSEWKHGTFDCCDSCSDCLCASFCPMCYDYTAVKAAGENTACGILVCLFPIALCCVRQNAREAKNIDGSPVNDFLCTWCCHCCAAIQLKREFD